MIEVVKTDQVVTVAKTDTVTNIAVTNQQVTVLEQVAGVQGAQGSMGLSGVISVTAPIVNSGSPSLAALSMASGLYRVSSSTFTSAARVQLDSIFSPLYRDYIVKLNITGSSQIGALTWQFRASGATLSGAVYAYESMNLTTTASGSQASTATSVPWVSGGIATPGFQNTLDVYAPAVSSIGTGFKGTGWGTYSTPTQTITAGRYTTASAVDGIDIYFGGVTCTGTVEIWGYK